MIIKNSIPILPKFPRGVLSRRSLKSCHEPSTQSSRILSLVRDPFLKLNEYYKYYYVIYIDY